jgi:uncharacterized protein (UPF0276 family)
MRESPIFPNLGLGLGLRRPHYDDVMAGRSKAQWFEVITENHMGLGPKKEGRPNLVLEKVRQNYPVVFHGVSLSLGGTEPLNKKYLKHLKLLVSEFEPAWVSDHLCWTGALGENLHDLLPLPYTFEAAKWVAERISQVQDFLGRRILIENVSSYMNYSASQMQEWEFLTEVSRRSDCALLLDINNVFVSSQNHDFDPTQYINGIPTDRVAQIHMAGHTKRGALLVDTHDQPICEDVFDLYRYFVDRHGPRSTMIEWDAQIPSLSELEAELSRLKIYTKEKKNAPQRTTGSSFTSHKI